MEHGIDYWRSLALWSLKEVRLKKLKLTRGEVEREYVRQIQGTWRYSDVDAVASELFDVLDSLIFLKASDHLPQDESLALPLEDPVTVQFQTVDGDISIARIGLVHIEGEQQTHVEVLGLRSLARDQGLHERLLVVLK